MVTAAAVFSWARPAPGWGRPRRPAGGRRMAEGHGDRVDARFYQAADLPPEGQRALLDAACAGQPALRAAVERLLADDARLAAPGAGTFLDSPLLRPPPPPTRTGCPAPAPA